MFDSTWSDADRSVARSRGGGSSCLTRTTLVRTARNQTAGLRHSSSTSPLALRFRRNSARSGVRSETQRKTGNARPTVCHGEWLFSLLGIDVLADFEAHLSCRKVLLGCRWLHKEVDERFRLSTYRSSSNERRSSAGRGAMSLRSNLRKRNPWSQTIPDLAQEIERQREKQQEEDP